MNSAKPVSNFKSSIGTTALLQDHQLASESFVASNIDDALELLSITNTGSVEVSAAKSVASGNLERHPERRMKSAWTAFEEREMPILKEENPGLRLSQLKQLLQKKWKKSPDNPLHSELNVSYNATKEEAKEQMLSTKEAALERMREK